MSNCCLVIGESGSGKSNSLRNLNPDETYLIKLLNKPLPFKGSKNKYIQKENGNYLCSDYQPHICKAIKSVNKRPEIKTLVIDDFQYLMGNEFMRRALEKGYDKFSQIGKDAWEIIMECIALRDDLDCFILSHSEESESGRHKCKTIGKMLDDKICLEGMFTVVLHSVVSEGRYEFITQNDGRHIAKSPTGMFEKNIENDLSFVKQKMNDYFNEA